MEEKKENISVVEEVNPLEEDKKKKQKNMAIAGGIAIVAIVAIALMLRNDEPPKEKPKEEIKIEKRDTLQENWVAEASKKMQELEKRNQELEKKIEETQKQPTETKNQESPPKDLSSLFSNKPPLPPAGQEQPITPPPPPPPIIMNQPVQPVQQPMQTPQSFPQLPPSQLPPIEIPQKPKPVVEKKVVNGLIYYAGTTTYGANNEQVQNQNKQDQNQEDKKEEKQVVLSGATYSPNPKELKTIKTYIPAGTITPAVILSGVDVPSGGGGTLGPIPVLLKIQDISILPNKFKSNIKECFIIGTAVGDLKSERAYIRTETLSCIREDQKVIEKQITGYVAGEDGKVGIIGRVVTKAGSMIARSLVAGFIEGVSRAFSAQSTIISTSPLGTTQTVDPNEAFRYGVSQGAARATQKLVDYYLNLANQLIPVIEINAGRKVDVIFLKGVQLDEI